MIGFLSNDDVQNVLSEDASNIIPSLKRIVSTAPNIACNNGVLPNVSKVQKKVTIAATCRPQFIIPSDCILIVTDFDVIANAMETTEDVALTVYDTMFLSMDNDSCCQELNQSIDVEMKYIQNESFNKY